MKPLSQERDRQVQLTGRFIFDEYPDRAKYFVLPLSETRPNYHFGAALLHHKHPVAKAYHTWAQRTKTKYREDFARRATLSHPHMTKFKEVWKTFDVLMIAASLKD